MNSIPLCQWRTSFAAVLFETDQVRLKSRIAEASRSIDQRLLSVREIGSVERMSIEMAQRSLAAMEREPPRPRTAKTVISARSNGAGTDIKRTQHGIGSHVRVTLPSGEMASAEIVVIFTASSRKNILVSIDKRFMRIGPEQILDCMSAKA
jgi:hypothetical protein